MRTRAEVRTWQREMILGALEANCARRVPTHGRLVHVTPADVEKDADASARREREMGTKLEAARAAAHAAREEADALRKDLKAALDERSELAAIKNMLKGAAGRKALATK